MVVIILNLGEGARTEKQILNYSKLQQIGMWAILQRIMSTLRHSYVTESDMVWHEVKGTRYRVMWMGPCTEWC